MGEAREAVLDAIRNRRSVRQYRDEPVGADEVQAILEAARWAPSGMNNQPWRFVVVRDGATRKALAELTHSGRIIREAPVSIAVFLDNEVSYDRVKDCQAIGACLQNMWLAVHVLGLGGVWLGEILKNKERVGEILGTPPTFELMAVMAAGHPSRGKRESTRMPLSELIFAEI
jgi:nitroreductase